MPDHQPTKA